MLAKILGAIVGRKVAGRDSKVSGALLGAGAAAIARRGLGPIAGVMAVGWGAKKLIDYSRGRKAADSRRRKNNKNS